MLRKFFIIMAAFGFLQADEIDLTGYEKSFYSFHGEDGLIARIFQSIPPKSRFLVDFSAGNGITGSNTYLLRLQGWNCLLMDRVHETLENKLYQEFITAENINDLFDKYRVPHEFDLLCMDHYNEFYIWKSLSKKYSPRVVIVKYNGTHLPNEDKLAKYRPYYCGDDTNYFGASILAMYKLARLKGYSLIYAENMGMNLFFVRDDVLEESRVEFKNTNDVEKIYRYPAYGKGPNGGYRQDPKNRPFISSQEVLCDSLE